jgi:hypothetical protein
MHLEKSARAQVIHFSISHYHGNILTFEQFFKCVLIAGLAIAANVCAVKPKKGIPILGNSVKFHR